jgi:pimeloyl-ACP methyl ester carboxylesterase
MRKSKLFHFVLLSVGIYLVFAALLFVFQRAFIYLPSVKYEHSFEQITLENDDVNIQVIMLNRGNENALIYFGGNAEAIIHNALKFSITFPTRTIYLVNYRGYGGSSGKPTEAGLFSDATAIFDNVSPAHKNIAVIGRSLGSGIAMHLAANRAVNQVVLITPYDSILAIAKKQFPVFPISLLLKDQYDSVGLANKVSAPVLVLAGGKDRIIPLSHSQKLVDALGSRKGNEKEQKNVTMIIFEQAGHNNISQSEDYYESLTSFFDGMPMKTKIEGIQQIMVH